MILEAHGIRVDLPAGWDGRIYRHAAGMPTLHAASFALPLEDGDFGTAATARMAPEGLFLSLSEYELGGGLEPGQGLFASPTLPLPLRRSEFSESALLRGRPGQAGLQHFFSTSGRCFCLYAVAGPRGLRAGSLRTLNHVLGTLSFAGARATGVRPSP